MHSTIALGQAIGRIGCFTARDDYGKPTSVPWAVTFTDSDAGASWWRAAGCAVAVQVYESVVCFALFPVSLVVIKAQVIRWRDHIELCGALRARRFLLEYFRGDADGGFVFGGALSTSQIIALPVFAIDLLISRLRRSMRILRSGSRPIQFNS